MSVHAAQESIQAQPPKSMLSRLKIPGVILGIVALEWVLAFLVMPSSSALPPISPVTASTMLDEAEPSGAHAGAPEGEDSHVESDPPHSEDPHAAAGASATAGPRHSDSEEVDLGNFTVSGFQPASNSTLFITFHLYGTVRHKYVQEFSQRLEENQHRIRDNVIVIIRSAEITDLTDAGLGLIKRRILETTNKTLGKPLLQEVVFSEFSFIEQ